MASAAVGAAAYELRSRMLPEVVSTTPKVLAKTGVARTTGALVPETDGQDSAATAAGATQAAPALEPPAAAKAPRANRIEVGREELRLLRRARVAVARNDFAGAMAPIAEHTRRFRDGHLVEEREALRVKALAGLGRVDEARRAAAAFKARFPHSVLLPAVSHMPASEP